jgi:hypothetical protein
MSLERRGKPVGRRRRTVAVLPGRDYWNDHPWRLARVALEPAAHRLRPEGWLLSTIRASAAAVEFERRPAMQSSEHSKQTEKSAVGLLNAPASRRAIRSQYRGVKIVEP